MWFGIAGAATVVAVVVLGASQLLPADRTAPGVGTGATLVVASDGSGDYGTIASAVAAAHDGDTILVRPGRYVESIFVDGKDLTIAGDGEHGTVTVVGATNLGPESPADAPSSDAYPWAFALADGDVALSDLTIESAGDAIATWGDGAPVLVGLDIRAPEGSPEGPGVWLSSTGGELRDSRVVGTIGIGTGSRITIVGNELPSTCIGMWDQDSQATIRDNTIRGCEREFGIHVGQGSTATIEGNDIEVPDLPADREAMYLEGLSGILLADSGDGVVIRDNAIHGSATGIMATASAGSVRIESNRVTDNTIGISVAGNESVLLGNTVTGNATGVLVTGLAPTLDSNSITGNDVGVAVGLAAPTLVGNTVCDNDTDLTFLPGREAPDVAGNEICGGAVAAGSGG